MSKRIYKAREGAHITDSDAQIYGDRIEQLRERTGYITPLIVVSDAEKKNSPLHNYFEWDDTKAAQMHRIEAAGRLIRSISVTVISRGEEIDVRYLYSVKSDPIMDLEEPKVYVNLDDAFIKTEDNKREEVIQYALRELKGWRERYKIYSELDEITRYIDEFIGIRNK